MSVFDELLAIKRFREGQAEIAVSRQRLRHAEADAARLASEQALADFRDESERRERAMYRDLCSRVVRVREIEDVLQGVAGLREGERQREQALSRRRSAWATRPGRWPSVAISTSRRCA